MMKNVGRLTTKVATAIVVASTAIGIMTPVAVRANEIDDTAVYGNYDEIDTFDSVFFEDEGSYMAEQDENVDEEIGESESEDITVPDIQEQEPEENVDKEIEENESVPDIQEQEQQDSEDEEVSESEPVIEEATEAQDDETIVDVVSEEQEAVIENEDEFKTVDFSMETEALEDKTGSTESGDTDEEKSEEIGSNSDVKELITTNKKEVTPGYNSKTGAPKIRTMTLGERLFGYSGNRVDYEDLEVGKIYIKQTPHKRARKGALVSFKYSAIKVLKIENNGGIPFLSKEVTVYYKAYDKNGKALKGTKKAIVNETIIHQTPPHFFEVTDDILNK